MTEDFLNGSKKIGIVGGGQLGRMFLQDAANFGVQVYILEADADCPAASLTNNFKKGNIQSYDDVYAFGQLVDVITIEIENVNTEALAKLQSEGKKVFPQPHIIDLIKDKGKQKQFYVDSEIPTSPFKLIENQIELNNHLEFLPFAQKLCKGGYDGKGVIIHRSKYTFSEGFNSKSVLEKFVDFEKELSVIVARNESGQIITYPLAEQEFNSKANLVEFLFTPADVSKEIEIKASEIAIKIISKLNMVGILAVELFLTKDGNLLVNEIAPRPHNSGHHTIEGAYTSQFEQHLRSIIDLPLGNCSSIMPAVMINLLGEEGFEGPVFYEGLKEALKLKGVYPHLYGKKTTKPYRKLGHITVINENLEEAKKIALQVKDLVHVKAK